MAVILSLHLARRSRGEMYSGHGRLCVCLRVYPSPHPHTTTRTRINFGHHTGCPPVVHYGADLQSMHGFRCYGNIHVCNLSLLTSNMYTAKGETSATAGSRSMTSSFYLLSFFSSPNLSGRRLDVYHTLTHGVALVRI